MKRPSGGGLETRRARDVLEEENISNPRHEIRVGGIRGDYINMDLARSKQNRNGAPGPDYVERCGWILICLEDLAGLQAVDTERKFVERRRITSVPGYGSRDDRIGMSHQVRQP